MPWNIEICIGFAILIYTYIYIYYKYICVFVRIYVSIGEKNKKHVLDEHPFASYFWFGSAAGSALAQTPDMDCEGSTHQRLPDCTADSWDRLKVSW